MVEASAATIASPFPRLQLATFVSDRARVQDVEWGGAGGFDEMGEASLAGREADFLFHILEPPATITFYNGTNRHTVDIPIVERTSGQGNATLQAIDLDPFLGLFVARVTAVPIFPANTATQSAFRGTRETRDNMNQLRTYTNISRLRWARPENIRIPPSA